METIAADLAASLACLRHHLPAQPELVDVAADVAEVLAVTIDQAARSGGVRVTVTGLEEATTLADAARRIQAAADRMASVPIAGRAWSKATLMATTAATTLRGQQPW